MAETKHSHSDGAIEDTNRIETFSDAIYAIVATLLVLELKVPVVEVVNSSNVTHALWDLAPEFVAFTFSFLLVAMYWMNHLYFFHHVKKADWRLVWFNVFHLFWITTVPFATALIGKYHTSKPAVVIYAIVALMAAVSMTRMVHYASFKGDLLFPGFSLMQKKAEFKRAMYGPVLYGLALVGAFINVYISIAIFIATPLFYLVPHLLSNEE